ncbi:MAG: DUF3473 domain-containing protein [Planctomycetota bacterium]
MKHAFSIDVEDWYQAMVATDDAVSARFEKNVMTILEALERHRVRATFFVLGKAAVRAPQVVKAIDAGGHEIQNHGFAHTSNFLLDEQAFREDLLKNKQFLEDLTGKEVYGYRAPYFTIDERNLWTLDVLAETGHRYDSSIFPLTRRCIVPLGADDYGIAGYPLTPQIVTTPRGHRIVEAPVTCIDWLGRRWPVGGGGYFRLWPYALIRAFWRRLPAAGQAGVVYLHPYEYDPREMAGYRGNVSLFRRLHQGLGRRQFPRKIDRLLADFRFTSMDAILADLLEQLPCASPS